jgi:hypothetical protein
MSFHTYTCTLRPERAEWLERVALLAGKVDPRGVVSDLSALALWRASRPDSVRPAVGPIELTVPPGTNPRIVGAVVHRRPLKPLHRSTVHGLAVTSPARTIVDVANFLQVVTIERLLDEWLATSVTTLADLNAVLVQLPPRGRRGSAVVRRLVDARTRFDQRMPAVLSAERAAS